VSVGAIWSRGAFVKGTRKKCKMVVYNKRLNNALSGRSGALGKLEGCAPAVGVLARGSVAALAAFPLVLARGTVVGSVERSEKER